MTYRLAYVAAVILGVWVWGFAATDPGVLYQRAARDLITVFVLLPVVAVESVVAFVALRRPRPFVLKLFLVLLYPVLVGSLSFVRSGWWYAAIEEGYDQLYVFAPWLAAGCAWIFCAGVVIFTRRRQYPRRG